MVEICQVVPPVYDGQVFRDDGFEIVGVAVLRLHSIGPLVAVVIED